MKISKLALLLLLASLAGACAESYAPVTVPFSGGKIVDFDAYRDLFYIDFICDVPGDGYDASAELRRVFTEEMSFAAGKPVVLLEPEYWDTVRGLLQRYRLAVDIQYEDSVFFRKVFQAHTRALFFAGKLKLNIKKMGVVKETRDERGNKKNVYETVQLWEMEMKVQLIDGDRAVVLWQETYTEKAEPRPGITDRFQIHSLIAKTAGKLAAALQPRKVLQERFILYK